MKKIKDYNITPAKGQALLNFRGRLFPDKIELFEAEKIEEIRNKKTKEQSLFEKEAESKFDFNNLLIQGDCLSACAYLKSQNIFVDLVYIDPPFASGANYAKKIYLRNNGKSAIDGDDNTIGEEIMYGDIWQKEDYLNWLYERLLAIKEIMSETASIYVHIDWHIGHYVKILLDEVFGEENFVNEIIWHYDIGGVASKAFRKKHDTIFIYSLSVDYIFNEERSKALNPKRYDHEDENGKYYVYYGEKRYMSQGTLVDDVWTFVREEEFRTLNSQSKEREHYATQKPENLIKRIINVSSDIGMTVADFFSGSGTTAKAAHDLNRRFIACDIGINAIQVTRDRLVKAGADFDMLKIKDGLRLFRNPAQTTAKIFSIIDGFKTRTELDLSEFWDGGIAKVNGTYTPVKFSGIHDRLTKELLDVYLEEIYKLEDTTDQASSVIIIYAHKDSEIDQKYLNKQISKAGKTELKAELVSLDKLLGEKRDCLFTPDNAEIEITEQGDKYKVEIKKYFSPYLKNKIDEYNAKKTKTGTIEQDLSKTIKISPNGLELIEAVQFDTTLKEIWTSNPALEDKAGIKQKIKGTYLLNTDKFKMKIRNIAGDEIIKEIRNPCSQKTNDISAKQYCL